MRRVKLVAIAASLCISGQMVRQDREEPVTTNPSQEAAALDSVAMEEIESLQELSAAKKVLRGYEPVRKGAAKVAKESEEKY